VGLAVADALDVGVAVALALAVAVGVPEAWARTMGAPARDEPVKPIMATSMIEKTTSTERANNRSLECVGLSFLLNRHLTAS
jgi:hypothetical protein